MNDIEMMNDMLITEKNMIKNYSTFITETSCPNMRQVLTQNMTETAHDQYRLFDTLRQRGVYPTKDAPDSEVTAAKQKLNQMK